MSENRLPDYLDHIQQAAADLTNCALLSTECAHNGNGDIVAGVKAKPKTKPDGPRAATN